MPKIKRSTSQVADSGFEIYTGDEPTVGVYRGTLKQLKVKGPSSAGNYYYNALVEFSDNTGTKAQYNGYPAWVMLTMTDKEANLRREKNFYRAIGVPEDAELDFDDDGKIKRLGGKTEAKILGSKVMVEMRMEDNNGENRVRGDQILPRKDAVEDVPAEPDEDDEDLLEEDDIELDEEEDDEELEDDEDEADEDESEEDDEVAERRAELQALTLPRLRKLTDVKGSKAELIDAILEAEFPEDEDEEDEDVDEEDEEELPSVDDYKKLKPIALRKKILADFSDDVDADDIKSLKTTEALVEFLVENELVDGGDPF